MDEIERITRERDDAQANYQFMVNRVADEKLEGYRELGQRAADAEKRAETAERERDALMATAQLVLEGVLAFQYSGAAPREQHLRAWSAHLRSALRAASSEDSSL